MADIDHIFLILHDSMDEHEKWKARIRLERVLAKKTIPELKCIVKTFSNEIIKRRAEFEIWRRKLDRTVENLLKIIHHCDDEDKIGEATKELGRQKFSDAIDLFIDLLKSKSSVIRTCAALALLDNPNQKAFRPLLRAIKKHKENCAVFVHALEVLDCNTAAEFLVDLFISKPDAPMVRINIIDCFESGAISRIPAKIGKKIKAKIFKAIRKSKDDTDKYELRRFYEEAVEQKIEKQRSQ
jgi:hypothetical protein